MYVVSVCSKYFIRFQTYIGSVLFICCICFTHILHVYVLNVSFVSIVCCNKCFMLQVQTVNVGVDEGSRVEPRPLMRGGGAGCVVQLWKTQGRVTGEVWAEKQVV
jgi:hypothetical protein